MKLKVYYENIDSTQGGWEYVSLFKIMYWLFIGRIKPKDYTDRYYIRKIETVEGVRI